MAKVTINRKKGESDQAYYHRLAKQADTRLDRLEEYSKLEGFKTATQWAYRTAKYDIKSFFGEKAEKFDRKLPVNADGTVNQVQFEARLNAVKRFLQSPSSSKTGIKSIYKKRADTINKRYGTKFTWEELANFYLKGYADKYDQSVRGSDVLMKAIGRIQRDDETIIKGIRKANAEQKQIDKDAIVGEVAERLKEQGFKWSDLK